MFFNMSQESFMVDYCRWTGPMIMNDLKKRILAKGLDSVPKRILDAVETKFDVYDKAQFLRLLGIFRQYLSGDGPGDSSFDDLCSDMLRIRVKDSSAQYYNLNGSIDFFRPAVMIEANGKKYVTKQEMLLAYSGYINEAMFDNTGLEPITKYMSMCETEKLAENLKFYELIETNMELENPNMFVGVPEVDEEAVSRFLKAIKAKSSKLIPDAFVEDIVEYIDETKEHYMMELFRIEFKMWFSEFPYNIRMMKLRLLITAMASIRCLIRFSKNGYLKRYTMRDKSWNKIPLKPPLLRSFKISNPYKKVYFFTAEVVEAVNTAHVYRKTGRTFSTDIPIDNCNSIFNTISSREFYELLGKEGLCPADIEVVETIVSLNSLNLPIHLLSPLCSACIPTYAAIIRVLFILNVNWKVAYTIPFAKFTELKHYMDDLCEFFIPSKNNLTCIEYNVFQRLIDDGNKRIKPILQKETNIGDINGTLTKSELKKRTVFRDDASKKLPKLEFYFDLAMESVDKMTLSAFATISRSIINFALMAEFPMIAKVIHRQGHCASFGYDVCLLDSCTDVMKGDLHRCDLSTISEYFQVHTAPYVKKSEDNKSKTKPKTSSSASSTPVVPSVPLENKTKNFLSGMKRGFFNKTTKEKDGNSSKVLKAPLNESKKPLEVSVAQNIQIQPEKEIFIEKTPGKSDKVSSVDEDIEETIGKENIDISNEIRTDENIPEQSIQEEKQIKNSSVLLSDQEAVEPTSESAYSEPVVFELETKDVQDFCKKLKEYNKIVLSDLPDEKVEISVFRTIVRKLLVTDLMDRDMKCLDLVVDGDMKYFLVFQSEFLDVFDVAVRGKEKKRYIRKKKNDNSSSPTLSIPALPLTETVKKPGIPENVNEKVQLDVESENHNTRVRGQQFVKISSDEFLDESTLATEKNDNNEGQYIQSEPTDRKVELANERAEEDCSLKAEKTSALVETIENKMSCISKADNKAENKELGGCGIGNKSIQSDFDSESEDEVKTENENKSECVICMVLIEKAIDDQQKLEDMENELHQLELEKSKNEMKLICLERQMEVLKLENNSCGTRQDAFVKNGSDNDKDAKILELNEALERVESEMSNWKKESEEMFMKTIQEKVTVTKELETVRSEMESINRTKRELTSKCDNLSTCNQRLLANETELVNCLTSCRRKNQELEDVLANNARKVEAAEKLSRSNDIAVTEKLKELGMVLRLLDETCPVEKANEILETFTSTSGDPNSIKLAEEHFAKYVDDYTEFRAMLSDNILNLVKDPRSDTLDKLEPVPILPIPFTIAEVIQIEKQCKSSYNAWCTVEQKKPAFEVEDTECLICTFDVNKDSETIKCENCNRRYHTKCVSEWIKKNSICPVCRSALPNPSDFPSLN